ncbi:MAG: bifunctional 2-C-methyl-D-erythritol 4-phosphate cytidylyltransferase/2-C-methyl-D-erythritol 2,4-cyclodiphosphate synthase [Alphaproteobacteria bacterium]|nr:bifunctional 2-C-methyl-D-erythritol 4-phosphate cytidylyltransferase/2-C-methyl-D-erythritol 2,4-cyclodiphosphate synthase [Alphaproteobacteria bacterium]
MTDIAALIVAAGRGARAGGQPKQFRKVAGRSLLDWSVTALTQEAQIELVQIVLPAGEEIGFPPSSRIATPVEGGYTRQVSVRRGLEALANAQPDFVLIHDAARPAVSPGLIRRVIQALRDGADAAVPLLAVSDTLKRTGRDGWQTVPREGLHRAQTPQGFAFGKILKAHAHHRDRAVTDDMALAELAGLKIASVPGEELNVKVTTAEDFSVVERILSRPADIRTGMGYDAHRFAAGDHVCLAGLRIPHDRALEGHSDADVALHALTDAVLGALGAGDIGQHFPPTDARWRGAESSRFLAHAAALARDSGAEILHCDITIVCERPRIGPHREAMRNKIAEILAVEVGRVSVKATTTEGMGFTGRGEGMAAQAVATLRF